MTTTPHVADHVGDVPHTAVRRALELAKGRGFDVVAAAASFLGDDVRGPLSSGELERARVTGRRLGREAHARRTARASARGRR